MSTKETPWLFGPGFKLLAEKQLGDGYQSQLAVLLGVKPAAVNQYLSGQHPMSEKTISALATALGTDYVEWTKQAMSGVLTRRAKAEAVVDDRPVVPAVKAAKKKDLRKTKAPSSDIPKRKPAKKATKSAA